MTISPLATASFTFPEPPEMKPGMEAKRKEAVWDLFQSESAFLRDHLMALKNVFMEPLKKVQVEGYVMFAEPEVLFGNLDELCCVRITNLLFPLNIILSNSNKRLPMPSAKSSPVFSSLKSALMESFQS